MSLDDLPGRLAAARAVVPQDALQSARLHLLDALGVGLVGARKGPVRGLVGLDEPIGPSTVLGSTRGAAPATAALINGSLIHSLEFDDTHVPSVMHGSSVIAAAALAEAQAVGASGRDLLTAFAVGWEFLIRIGLASPGRIQARGFQITSAGGAFAAAATSCLLRGDAPDVFADAIGIAGSQAGGTFAFLQAGDTVKAVQPGWAAHAGVMAAAMARAGVTGPRGVFRGRYGFFSLYADDPDGADRLAEELADLGTTWHLPRAAFKLVPCCHYIHPFVEALQGLVEDGVTVPDLEDLHCWVPTEVISVIAEPWATRQHPAKPHDARWSLPYVLAGYLVYGRLDLSMFDGELDQRILAITDRVTFEPWPDSGYPARFPARLRATLIDGSVSERVIEDVKGGASRPIDASDVIAKARANLLEAGLDDSSAERLVVELVDAPDPDIATIGTLLRRVG